MRWMLFLLIGCGKSDGMVGSQGQDTATAVDDEVGLGLIAIEGGTFTLGETDTQTYAEYLGGPGEYRTIITTGTFEIDDFLMARFPFPGVEGAAWFTDGAHHTTIEALDAALADFGRRACTISELLYAAAGPDNKRFPYGDTREEGQCDGDDRNPLPIGTFPGCTSDLGIQDFQVRSTWGVLDTQVLSLLNDAASHESVPADLTYGVWGGTSRTDTIQAPTNFGFHTHSKDGDDRYFDDGFRVCADETPTANEDFAYERWQARAIDAGSFEAFFAE